MGPGKWDARESNVHARVREGLVGVFLSLSLSLARARARAFAATSPPTSVPHPLGALSRGVTSRPRSSIENYRCRIRMICGERAANEPRAVECASRESRVN